MSNEKVYPFRQFRLEHRIKLEELSISSGINYSILSRIENKWRNPKLQEIEKILTGYKKLNINTESLIK